jgi:ABC-2 type transport system permease protein
MTNRQTQMAVIKLLVLKDWQLHRAQIFITIILGAVALTTLLLKREAVTVVGSVSFFIALILIGCMLPATNILNERKKQNMPYVMSLPITSVDYTTAKLAGTLGMFLIPWVTLLLAAVWLIAIKSVMPHGVIPMALILLTLPFVGFSLITALTLIGETEGWSIAGNVVCNSSYGLIWYFITQTPSLMKDLGSPHAVWNSAVVRFLASEFALIGVILVVTYYVQSRKRDFI